MANFPTNLDTIKKDWANDSPVKDTHPSEHNLVAESVEALEAKVGVDGSAITTTHDYKLSSVTGSNKSSTLAGTETLTNKTLTTPVIATISNSGTVTLPTGTNTLVGRSTTDTLTNKTLISPALTTPVLNTSISGTAFLDEDDFSSNSDNKVASQQSIKAYVDAQASTGVPDSFSVSNMLAVVSFSDEIFNHQAAISSQLTLATPTTGGVINSVSITGTWSDATNIIATTICFVGDYMYIVLENSATAPDTFRIYRYDKSNITATGTLMSFSGATVLETTDDSLQMASDGTNFYFSFQAGNSSNQYVIAKYTLSGTTLAFDSTITLSDSATFNQNFVVDSVGNIYTINSGSVKKYNASGILQYTSEGTSYRNLVSLSGTIYAGDNDTKTFTKLFV